MNIKRKSPLFIPVFPYRRIIAIAADEWPKISRIVSMRCNANTLFFKKLLYVSAFASIQAPENMP